MCVSRTRDPPAARAAHRTGRRGLSSSLNTSSSSHAKPHSNVRLPPPSARRRTSLSYSHAHSRWGARLTSSSSSPAHLFCAGLGTTIGAGVEVPVEVSSTSGRQLLLPLPVLWLNVPQSSSDMMSILMV